MNSFRLALFIFPFLLTLTPLEARSLSSARVHHDNMLEGILTVASLVRRKLITHADHHHAVDYKALTHFYHKAFQDGQLPSSYEKIPPLLALFTTVLLNESQHLHHTCKPDNLSATILHITEQDQKANPTQFFLAINLKQNSGLLAHMTRQILLLALYLGPKNIYVSVYESGSTDTTAGWLQLLQIFLRSLHIPNRIATGQATRSQGQERIDFLATVRNAALAPLQDANHTSSQFDPEYIIFINDAFHCASDLLRLTYYKADLACGLDVEGYTDKIVRFRDTWVARDTAGGRFSNDFPFVDHEPTVQRFKSNLPTPVQCCWNGAAVMRAAPFKGPQKLRFRSHQPNECAASECTLLCDDLHRLGHSTIILDPMVRVAYEEQFWRALRAEPYPQAVPLQGLPRAGELVQQLKVETGGAFNVSHNTVCCDIRPGQDGVNFVDDCRTVDLFAVNFTAAVLAKP